MLSTSQSYTGNPFRQYEAAATKAAAQQAHPPTIRLLGMAIITIYGNNLDSAPSLQAAETLQRGGYHY